MDKIGVRSSEMEVTEQKIGVTLTEKAEMGVNVRKMGVTLVKVGITN